MKSKIIIFLSFFILTTKAHAYLDPGTGSIILQGIIGALAAGVVTLKLYWHKLLKLLGIRKKIIIDQENENEKDKKDI